MTCIYAEPKPYVTNLGFANSETNSINTEYLAITVVHHGNQAAEAPMVRDLLGLKHKDDYRVELTAMLSEGQYRPQRKTAVPNISGVERGFIDGPADSDYAQIDDHGRYKVKLHFDIDDRFWMG